MSTLQRQHGLSQEQLATQIGISQQDISKWESGISTPELDKLLALSQVFAISIDELTCDELPLPSPQTAPEQLVAPKAG
ncbi:MAG: helix-turn-helix transcriptional regulator [Firmicutes bacterium]|nr:helix-turn-helix transcriptional regulator [Bacillota bacterium]